VKQFHQRRNMDQLTGSYISSYCHVVGCLPMSVIC
jgi:hypothetical protein